MSPQLSHCFDDLRSLINRVLEDFLSAQRGSLSAADPEAVRLLDEVVATVAAGGGRIRPIFCYWGYRAGGGAHGGEILAAASSLELLHTFAIIHDDVIDAAALRRGKPSTSRRLAGEARRSGRGGDPQRFGPAAAILAGDLAFVLSDRLLADSGFAPPALARASRPLGEMRVQAIAGEYLDLLYGGTRPRNLEMTHRIARLKTASYSVEGPLLIGAVLAGGANTKEIERALSRYGSALGEAYQLRDDVLGLFGDPNVTGKDVEGDLRAGKPTVLIAEALRRAACPEREAITKHWGNPEAGTEEIEVLRAAVRFSGGLRATLACIDGLVEDARRALAPDAETIIPRLARAALEELAEGISSRTLRLP
ncbi:MAG: polyprenyl synthetase family protein [Actinomycetota bacterium]